MWTQCLDCRIREYLTGKSLGNFQRSEKAQFVRCLEVLLFSSRASRITLRTKIENQQTRCEAELQSFSEGNETPLAPATLGFNTEQLSSPRTLRYPARGPSLLQARLDGRSVGLSVRKIYLERHFRIFFFLC